MSDINTPLHLDDVLMTVLRCSCAKDEKRALSVNGHGQGVLNAVSKNLGIVRMLCLEVLSACFLAWVG